MVNTLSFNKILFPNLISKDIKPLAFLLSPSDLVVCLSLIIILAQISDSLKGFLSFKEIQRISSVKFYSKLLSVGRSSVSLSFVYAVTKSLGRDLDALSVLSSSERINFLRSLHFSLIHQRISKTDLNSHSLFSDPFDLMLYRRNLALKCRTVFSSTPIFLPHSLVIGVPVKNIDLSLIVESCKSLWCSWGLNESEFDFRLRKDAMKLYVNNSNFRVFYQPSSIYDCCKILLFSELPGDLVFAGKIFHDKDLVFLSHCRNLTLLEKDFGFFIRPFPIISPDFSVNSINLRDDVIRLAVEQRKTSSAYLKNFSSFGQAGI
jgi:hypothetical protein